MAEQLPASQRSFREWLESLTEEQWLEIARRASERQRKTMGLTECPGCGGKPEFPNVPCVVCGRKP